MKNIIVSLCLIGSGCIILASLHAGTALAYFLLAGVIPGTTIALSSTEMLAFYTVMLGLVFARLFVYFYKRRPIIQKKA